MKCGDSLTNFDPTFFFVFYNVKMETYGAKPIEDTFLDEKIYIYIDRFIEI